MNMAHLTLTWAILFLPTAAPLEVTVETLSGPPRTGALVELDERQVAIETAGQRESIDLRDLLALAVDRSGQPKAAEPASVWIELNDGSRIDATSYTVTNRVATMRVGEREMKLDTGDILSVRFHAPSAELEDQWREICKGVARGDVVVLRRSKTSLDQLEGVFHDVTQEAVDFEFEDQRIAVNRAKLEGIVYFHPKRDELPAAACAVVETNGTTWRAKSLKLTSESLAVTTTGGTSCDVPLGNLARLDFSAGNVTYLSDLEFELAECTPFIATRLPEKRVLQLYEPRRDASYEGSGLWLGDGAQLRQYLKGLSIHSRSLLVFRLKEPFRKLTADVGIDSRLHGNGNVDLVIKGDDKELYRRTIAGTDEPLALDLNIEGVRRLEILVDFGETLDVADHLNLCNARVIK